MYQGMLLTMFNPQWNLRTKFLSLLDLRQNTTKMSDGDFFTAGIIGYVCMSMVVKTSLCT